jgi:hypothetical protein
VGSRTSLDILEHNVIPLLGSNAGSPPIVERLCCPGSHWKHTVIFVEEKFYISKDLFVGKLTGIRYLTSEVAEQSGYHSAIKIANFCIFRGM